ncbi:MAG: diguanylate cyclase [Fibrobacter sp.]|nr:diguanylate cyclase [Fibrobacter sp.]
MSQYNLVVLYPQKMFKQFPLEVGSAILGRGQDADFKLEDELVSRKHCALHFDGNQVVVEDLGSTNGTFIDGSPVQKATLGEDNRLQLGSMVLKLEKNDPIRGAFDLKIYEASTLDDQTGVCNYRTFMNRSLGEIILARKNNLYMNVLMVEADPLDSPGEALGERCSQLILREIARILGEEKRDSDQLARYNGGKFIILMTGINPEDAQKIAEKIRTSIEKMRFSWKDSVVPVRVSAGLFSKQGDEIPTLQEMVCACRKLLEAAHEAGGNQVQAN